MSNSTPRYCDACGQANRPDAHFCFNCGQSFQTGDPASGQTAPEPAQHSSLTTGQLGPNHLLKHRYRIMGQMGRGGMGAVYKAEDTQFGDRLVAVKEMSQHGLSPEEVERAAEAFKYEALLLAGLMHPNLPRIYDHFSDEGQWYLVMDFIQGETLETYLERRVRESVARGEMEGAGGLPLEEVVDIGIQLCSVLGYLHTRQPPIIFRDLKPENVMIMPEEHIYLIDFGIARHFKPGQARDTRAFVSWGYAAPEQYGKTQTTPRSDIYSLGATLHHLLTGVNPTHTPFRFAPLRDTGDPALGELERLIMTMVSIDESQRPESMVAIKQELQHIAAQRATEQLGGASHLETHTQPWGTQPVQPSPKATRPQQGTRLFTYRGHSDRVFALGWSPDGRRIVSGGYDHTLQVWDANNGREIFTYRGHSEPVRAAAWSPDGKLIASSGNDHSVQIWSAATGSKVHTYRGHSDSVLSVSWSPDNKYIASAGLSKTPLIWETATGSRITTLRGHTSLVNHVAWSPDGTRVATSSLDKTVRVYDASTWQTIFTYRGHSYSVTAAIWSPDSRYIASASEDKTVQVWDATSGDHTFTYNNHIDEVLALSWSPDGQRIASTGEDKTVQVWDSTSGDHIYTYHEHPEDVNVVAWSPAGTHIVSAGDDGSVHVWQAG